MRNWIVSPSLHNILFLKEKEIEIRLKKENVCHDSVFKTYFNLFNLLLLTCSNFWHIDALDIHSYFASGTDTTLQRNCSIAKFTIGTNHLRNINRKCWKKSANHFTEDFWNLWLIGFNRHGMLFYKPPPKR